MWRWLVRAAVWNITHNPQNLGGWKLFLKTPVSFSGRWSDGLKVWRSTFAAWVLVVRCFWTRNDLDLEWRRSNMQTWLISSCLVYPNSWKPFSHLGVVLCCSSLMLIRREEETWVWSEATQSRHDSHFLFGIAEGKASRNIKSWFRTLKTSF